MRLQEVEGSTVGFILIEGDGRIARLPTRFVKHLGSRGCGPNYLRHYCSELSLYFEYLHAQGIQPCDMQIDSFIDYMAEAPPSTVVFGRRLRYSPVAIRSLLTTISKYYEFLATVGDESMGISATQALRLASLFREATHRGLLADMLTVDGGHTYTVYFDDLLRVYGAIPLSVDRLLIQLLLFSPCTVREVIGLRVENVLLKRSALRTEIAPRHGADKPQYRNIVLDRDLMLAVVDHIATKPEMVSSSSHVFYRLNNRHVPILLTVEYVDDLLIQVFNSTDIDLRPAIRRTIGHAVKGSHV